MFSRLWKTVSENHTNLLVSATHWFVGLISYLICYGEYLVKYIFQISMYQFKQNLASKEFYLADTASISSKVLDKAKYGTLKICKIKLCLYLHWAGVCHLVITHYPQQHKGNVSSRLS